MKNERFTYIAVITLLALTTFYFFDRNRKKSQIIENQSSILTEQQDTITNIRNREGQWVARSRAAEATTQQIKEGYKEDVEMLRRELGVAVRDLKAYVKAEFVASGSGETTIVHNHYTDSSGVVHSDSSFVIDDGFLNMIGKLELPKVTYNYKYSDEILYAFHTDKKWFLGKERLYGSGRLKNPNAQIINATDVLIDDFKDKRWTVSLGVSYLPFLDEDKFQPAIHFGYSLVKF